MKEQTSIRLSAEEIREIQQATSRMIAILKPKLSSLSAHQRRQMLCMGDRSEPFVEKAISFASSNPEFLPPYVNQEGLQDQFLVLRELTSLFRPLEQVMRLLEDNILLSGNGVYTGALAYYSAVKRASRLGVAAALPIFEEMRQRFVRQGTRKSDNSSA